MLNNPKGFQPDSHNIELPMQSHFNADGSHEMDHNLMFFPPPMDMFANLAEDLHSTGVMPHLPQELKKSLQNPQADLQSIFASQMNPRTSLLGFRTDQEMSEDSKLIPEDGGDSDSDGKSNSSNKRGKYRTYTDEEKAKIISFMLKHGIQKTLELFSGGEHKITKRKLKSWLENQNKVKGVKGRKSTDPVRDDILYKWCMNFQNEHGRPPSRKETTTKALELSGDPSFQASKGWLDKFSRKFNIEFTPLKIIPPRGRKKIKTGPSEGVSATSTLESVLTGSLSPLRNRGPKKIEAEKNNSANSEESHDPETIHKPGSLFSLNAKHNKVKQRPQQPDQQQSSQPTFPQLTTTSEVPNHHSFEQSFYPAFHGMDGKQPAPYPYPLLYPMEFNPMQYNFNRQNPVAATKPYSLNYPMNLSLPLGLADNFQRFHQMIKKDDLHLDKNN